MTMAGDAHGAAEQADAGQAPAGPVIAGLGEHQSLHLLTALITLPGAILGQPTRIVR
jgi:hypothetical protein